MGTVVNLDGELLSPDAARISVFDRGFLYGDSVYEVVRTYGGEPFELSAHLDRLLGSADRIGFKLPWGRHRCREEMRRTLDAAGNLAEGRESYVRVIMTRGAGEIGLDPALAVDPVKVIIVKALEQPPRSAYERGVDVAVVAVQRTAPQAVDPGAKTGNYLNNVLALREARARGAYEALMLDGAGHLAEGSTSNLFLVRDGTICTPSLETGILEGVTRRVVLDVAREEGVPVEECRLGPDDLAAADEVFVTGTVREIVPATRVDGRPVSDGQVGPVTRRVQAAFRRRTGPPVDGARF